jgi:two-component system nitrogen regulation sensor histidine kinase NtrY
MGSERRRSFALRPLRFENRIFLLALGAGAPGVAAAGLLLAAGGYSAPSVAAITALVVGAWLAGARAARRRVVRPLQTLSNLLVALREEDFSFRARVRRPDDALGLVLQEVNALEKTLRSQRLGAVEAGALLRSVMAEIDVAVFAFDGERRLKLVNRAGERLLGEPSEALIDRTAEDLHLAGWLSGEPSRTLQIEHAGGVGRWSLRRSTFREGGLPHQLLVLTDLSQTLREEERQVWERLLRVLGHEVNNSLAPIKSIAESLASLLARQPIPQEVRDDMGRGLAIVGSRADALSRFLGAYARLARLPKPNPGSVEVVDLVERVAALETRRQVLVRPGPVVRIRADQDQIEQVLINLLRNAVDASLETGGGVSITWRLKGRFVEILVEDEGPGLSNTANLFVPFFTTKPGGSGIGLVLSRQIAEAHGGNLALANREPGPGCTAMLRLPRGLPDSLLPA